MASAPIGHPKTIRQLEPPQPRGVQGAGGGLHELRIQSPHLSTEQTVSASQRCITWLLPPEHDEGQEGQRQRKIQDGQIYILKFDIQLFYLHETPRDLCSWPKAPTAVRRLPVLDASLDATMATAFAIALNVANPMVKEKVDIKELSGWNP